MFCRLHTTGKFQTGYINTSLIDWKLAPLRIDLCHIDFDPFSIRFRIYELPKIPFSPTHFFYPSAFFSSRKAKKIINFNNHVVQIAWQNCEITLPTEEENIILLKGS